jgi:hypothetical protein
MTQTLADGREALEHLSESVQEAIDRLLEEARAVEAGVDTEYADRFADSARRLTATLNEQVPPDLDPEALAEVRGYIIEMLNIILEREGELLDALDSLLVRAEALRHVVRDAMDEQVPGHPDDGPAQVAALDRWMPRVSQSEKAQLVGVSTRTLQRIGKGETPGNRRLDLVARVAAILRRAWTAEGVLAWFQRPRTDLDGHAPIDALDDPDLEAALLRAARRGRAQHGA